MIEDAKPSDLTTTHDATTHDAATHDTAAAASRRMCSKLGLGVSGLFVAASQSYTFHALCNSKYRIHWCHLILLLQWVICQKVGT